MINSIASTPEAACSESLNFSEQLLDWFDLHGRKNLPWQHEVNPYRVWLSEIMLQQTQVNTVIPYFERFVARFPSLEELASAGLDEVLHLWAGLGYYARGRNLHKCAQRVANEYAGRFPQNLDELVALPGIGLSTAAAICSIAFNQQTAILDGNVKRVLARYHAVTGWPGRPSVEKVLWEHANTHMPPRRCADYTQAIMDLGATLCTRSKPQCQICPVSLSCKALTEGVPTHYPEKKPRTSKPVKSVFMLAAKNSKGILLELRPTSGIWGGLWSFPEFATETALLNWCTKEFGRARNVTRLNEFRHTFSHYHLDITPIVVETRDNLTKISENTFCWYRHDNQQELGFAAPVKKLLLKISEFTHG